jgi:hypothetical protein
MLEGFIAIAIGFLLDLVRLGAALVVFRLMLLYANRSGVTGQKFFLHTWLDQIAEDRRAQAVVVGLFLVAVAIVLHGLVAG